MSEKGEFMPEKHGIYITEDGKYVGEFRQGRPDGQGKYSLFQGEDFNKRTLYAGEWENGSLVRGTVENHLFKYEG